MPEAQKSGIKNRKKEIRKEKQVNWHKEKAWEDSWSERERGRVC